MSKEKGLSLRDSKILTMATRGATAEQIGSELGIPAVRVVGEIDRLTKSLDWLTELQELKLTMAALKSLVGSIQEQAESGHDDKISKVYVDALRLLFERIDKQSERADLDLEKVSSAHARKFMEIIEKSFYATLATLRERYPSIEGDEIERVFQENVLMVSAEFDRDE